MYPKRLLRPDRLRRIERPFAWLPCRLLTEGWLGSLSIPANLLHLLLSLASDRQGLSYFGDPRICAELSLSPDELHSARQELINRDMLAFDGRIYQLLPLPRRLAIPRQARPAQGARDRGAAGPEHVGQILNRILGTEE